MLAPPKAASRNKITMQSQSMDFGEPVTRTARRRSSRNIFKKLGRLFKRSSGRRRSHESDSIEKVSNKQISEHLAAEECDRRSTLDILLLGAGGSGKTTVFKQMQKLFHGFIDEKEMEFAIDDIRENIMVDIIDLCKFNEALKNQRRAEPEREREREREQAEEYTLHSSELQGICERIARLNAINSPNQLLTCELAKEIEALWNDKALQHTWQARKKSHIMDNTPYFLNKVQSIAAEGYRVSFDDYVRLRDQTTGIIHKKFMVTSEHGNYKFNVTDVGGQRSERRKWLKLFDNVDVVVYLMNLAGYDQVLFEDNSKNCLAETLLLFEQTCAAKAFRKTDWVVFFNKADIFEEKIKTVPFTAYEPAFPPAEAQNPDKVQEYVQQEFTKRFSVDDGQRQIYFHTTCATDSAQVGQIIKKVQIDIIASAMKKMGMVV